jgi:hypothetical protein
MLLKHIQNGVIFILQHFLKDRTHRPHRPREIKTSGYRILHKQIQNSLLYQLYVIHLRYRRRQSSQTLLRMNVNHPLQLLRNLLVNTLR